MPPNKGLVKCGCAHPDAFSVALFCYKSVILTSSHSGIAQEGSGPRILAIRADMDGLPVTETSGASYASTIPGKAHSCGHDGHVASALGAALLLHARKERLPSNCTVRSDKRVSFVYSAVQ